MEYSVLVATVLSVTTMLALPDVAVILLFRVGPANFSYLFCYLVCSLRVSLDLGKVVYSWMIIHDKAIPGTVVRSSTIPEELGRIGYLLSDKTGTLTENEMVLES